MTAEPSVPDPPERLGDPERVEWVRVVALLASSRVLTAHDQSLIERYCCTLVLWRLLDDDVREHGTTEQRQTEHDSYTAERPQVRQRDREAKTLLAIERELGLTPASRCKVKVGANDPPTPVGKKRFFGG
jgi:P27 family predicted phage terminase small subunit